MSQVNTPISIGELLDKITILEIKSIKITDDNKLKNVKHELGLLTEIWQKMEFNSPEMLQLKKDLTKVNLDLWVIEDDIRIMEKNQSFDQKFVTLARSVYFQNDIRAAVKKEINLLTGSELIEEKSYESYSN